MKINSEKLLKALDERWKDTKCPYCGDHDWTVDPTIITTLEVNQNRVMHVATKFQPLVAVTCRCCGNTPLVNALILDCLEDEEKGKEE